MRGRGLTEEDRASVEQVAILDETLAQRLFPSEDPLGRRMRAGLSGLWRTITGIARTLKNDGLTGVDDPEYYFLWRKGAALGLAAAWVGSRYLESMLFEVKARDLPSFTAVFGFLIAVSVAAVWQPSRRAVRVDPAQVLRHE
jgi:hypothetical protein